MANTTIYPYGQNGSLPGEDIIELDPIFTESPAYGITSADITNWNSKTSNTGTVTSVKVGATSYSPSSGVVSLPAYPTTASDIGAQDTLVSGTNIKTINNESLLGSGNITISGGSGEENVIEAVTFNGVTATITNKTAAITATIPTEVTESTVSGWGFTKNVGTLTTETDPVFSASAASGITSSDITNWNSKTSNTGTLTGVSFNGTAATVTNGVANITATISSGLPSVTSTDNGKVLKVVNGAWDKSEETTVTFRVW